MLWYKKGGKVTRSISHLIGLIPVKTGDSNELKVEHLHLPLDQVEILRKSSLAFHLSHMNAAAGVVSLWKSLKAKNKQIPIEKASEIIKTVNVLGPDELLEDIVQAILPSIMNLAHLLSPKK